MRSLLASLLIMSLVLTEAQGARLGKGLIPDDEHHIIHEEEGSLIKTSNGGVEDHEDVHCKDGHCSLGKYRKLMTKKPCITTTSTTSKNNVKKGGNEAKSKSNKGKSENEVLVGKEENFSVNSSPVSEHRAAGHEPYPDIIDIAEMDYSPARRKPPIHN